MSKAGRVLGIALAALGGALALGCGGDGGDPYQPPLPNLVDHVEVSPGVDTLTAIGATRRYSAVAKAANGNTVTGVSFTWSSTATGVATVASDGTVTAVGNGTATIRAKAGDVTGSGTAVIVQVATSIDVTPTPVGLAPGETIQLEVSAEDANGHAIDRPSLNWTTSHPSIAQVNSSGLVTALNEGQATITAASDATSGGATVTVLTVGLVTIRDLVSDPFVDHLINYLETTTGANLEIAMRDMANALGEGNESELSAALTTAQSIVAAGSQDDAVLLAYLELVLDHCRSILDQLLTA
jgi:hypothetical protein